MENGWPQEGQVVDFVVVVVVVVVVVDVDVDFVCCVCLFVCLFVWLVGCFSVVCAVSCARCSHIDYQPH